jgi:tRNA A37 N6-isopentenylltransferase MiaA
MEEITQFAIHDIQAEDVKALQNCNMRFTHRQIKWFAYDKIYKKMLISPPPMKKRLRKSLNDFREKVQKTPTTYVSTIFVSAFV